MLIMTHSGETISIWFIYLVILGLEQHKIGSSFNGCHLEDDLLDQTIGDRY